MGIRWGFLSGKAFFSFSFFLLCLDVVYDMDTIRGGFGVIDWIWAGAGFFSSFYSNTSILGV